MKKRKQFKVTYDPLGLAMLGAAVTDKATLDKLRMLELSAIEAFRVGSATPTDWQAMADLVNLSESMAQAGIGPEAIPIAAEAERHLLETADRYQRTGKVATTGPGLVAFRELYEYHDLQRQSVARSVYESHIIKVANQIRSKSPRVKVATKEKS